MSYGYHSNPMYNYMETGDRISQGYLQLDYAKSAINNAFRTRYVGGLAAFNKFSDRNYYEHNISFTFRKVLKAKSQDSSPISLSTKISVVSATADEKSQSDSLQDSDSTYISDSSSNTGSTDDEITNAEGTGNTEAVEEDEEEEESLNLFEQEQPSFFELTAKLGRRHDKPVFSEFDNSSLEISALYKAAPSPKTAFYVYNTLGLRLYTKIDPLSNVTDILSAKLVFNPESKFQYGFSFSAGFKLYTKNAVDTLFSNRIDFDIQIDTIQVGKITRIVIDTISVDTVEVAAPYSMPKGTVQYSFAAFSKFTWSSGSFGIQYLYRFNPQTTTRFLANYVNSTRLNEDIYNEFFSYTGSHVIIGFNQKLPAEFNLGLEFEYLQRKYNIGAADLEGNDKLKKRKDNVSSLDYSLSRNFNLSDSISFDITLAGQVFKNNSNDDYNNFSGSFFTLSLGIGF